MVPLRCLALALALAPTLTLTLALALTLTLALTLSNLFQDPLDGKAYLIRDCEHKFVGISQLSSDYLNTTGEDEGDCPGRDSYRATERHPAERHG